MTPSRGFSGRKDFRISLFQICTWCPRCCGCVGARKYNVKDVTTSTWRRDMTQSMNNLSLTFGELDNHQQDPVHWVIVVVIWLGCPSLRWNVTAHRGHHTTRWEMVIHPRNLTSSWNVMTADLTSLLFKFLIMFCSILNFFFKSFYFIIHFLIYSMLFFYLLNFCVPSGFFIGVSYIL